MKLRRFLVAVFLVIGLAAGWMTCLTWKAGEDSKWLFGVFAAFFLVLAGATFLPAAKKKNPATVVQGTHFVPAWQMEGMILLAVLLVILSIIFHFIHPAKP
jgi:zinc transporter ZupT